jgi:MFS family permease
MFMLVVYSAWYNGENVKYQNYVMINALIHRFLKRRHFWRYATFGEVAELYASRLMRIFALRLVSTFTVVYMYQLGFSLLFIALFWAAFYFLKVISAYPAARIIARFGPKHATLYSNVISAVSMAILPFVSDPTYGIVALAIWCIFQGFSGAMNDLAYLVDFSKVKHAEHAGKEIGFMNVVERIAAGISPLVGGLIAFAFGPQSIMVLSALLFILSAVPLFLTAEPIRLQKGLNFKGFDWRSTWRSFVAEAAIGVDIYSTNIVWPVFLVVVIFIAGGNQVYAEIGAVTSVTFVVAFVISGIFGRLIDHRRGKELLTLSTYLNSSIHMIRGFITTPIGVVLTNATNEMATIGYSMPFLRGMFDLADRTDRRIEYLFIIEMTVNFGAALTGVMFAALIAIAAGPLSLQIFFIIAAALTLLIKTPRFPLYQR